MVTRNEIVKYVIESYYDDVQSAADASGYSKQQITNWINGHNQPNQTSVGWLLHRAFVPEFQVIAEFKPIDISGTQNSVTKQLRSMLKGHLKASGIYAFYDSMVNLVYLGKSDGNLFVECCTQLKAKLGDGIIPKGPRLPKTRLDIVRYVSAYNVKGSDFQDYAKHIESLILRISKPVLNKNLGKLEKTSHK